MVGGSGGVVEVSTAQSTVWLTAIAVKVKASVLDEPRGLYWCAFLGRCLGKEMHGPQNNHAQSPHS